MNLMVIYDYELNFIKSNKWSKSGFCRDVSIYEYSINK